MEKEDASFGVNAPDALLDKPFSIIDLLGQDGNAANIPFEPVKVSILLKKADLLAD